MTAQKDGLKFEKDLAAAVDSNTSMDTNVVFGGGTSGNVRFGQPDLYITTRSLSGDPEKANAYAIELKRSTKDRRYISDDFSDLNTCRNRYTSLVFVMKFTHREPLVVQFPPDERVTQQRVAESVPDCFNATVTDGGRLRLDKPETDEWPSSQSGLSDHEAVIFHLNLT